jgi:hypothetical protein
VRPVWRPWWRRRGPRTVLLAGAAAVLLIAGTAVWLVAQAPAAPRDHSGDLRQYLLPAPPGSTVSVPDGLVSAASIDDSLFAAATVQQAGVRQVAVEAWLEPVGQNRVRVGLVRFESDDQASQVLSGFLLMKGGRPVNRGSGTYRERPVPPPSTTVPRPWPSGNAATCSSWLLTPDRAPPSPLSTRWPGTSTTCSELDLYRCGVCGIADSDASVVRDRGDVTAHDSSAGVLTRKQWWSPAGWSERARRLW